MYKGLFESVFGIIISSNCLKDKGNPATVRISKGSGALGKSSLTTSEM